ncbi:precorrin-6A reductase [Desulfotomaculum varum]
MILVLAGTLEGRETAFLLQQAGFMVTATTVTEYGCRLLQQQGLTGTLTGPLDEAALGAILGQGFQLLVDATHPFAEQASRTAMAAARAAGVAYLRLERPRAALPDHPLVYRASDLTATISQALELGKVLFSTLGSKSLASLLAAAASAGARVVARVLPDSEVIRHCCRLGLTPDQIIALQGPCSVELNKALYRQYQAEVVLTKDSGYTGGVPEKIAAALAVGLPVVVWQRPLLPYPLVLHSPVEVLQYCLHNLAGQPPGNQ